MHITVSGRSSVLRLFSSCDVVVGLVTTKLYNTWQIKMRVSAEESNVKRFLKVKCFKDQQVCMSFSIVEIASLYGVVCGLPDLH